MSDVFINATEIKELKAEIIKITGIYREIDDRKEDIKAVVASIEDRFSIKKKLINKIAKTMYNHNYSNLQAENEHFEFLYEAIAEGKKMTAPEGDEE